MNTPFDRTLDCPKWKSHDYKVCYTHQVLHFVYWSTFLLEKFEPLNFKFSENS